MEDVTISKSNKVCTVCKHEKIDVIIINISNDTKICMSCVEEFILWFTDYRRIAKSTEKEYF